MRKKFIGLIVLTMTISMALTCGPGNGKAPYKGSSYQKIVGGGDMTIKIHLGGATVSNTFTVLDTYKDTYGDPVPNIEVQVTFGVSTRTIDDYSVSPFVLQTADGEVVDYTYGTVVGQTDFDGKVGAILTIPPWFDGKVWLEAALTNSYVTSTYTVIFDSGTTCTNGQDDNGDGFADNADPICIAGGPFASE